MNQIIKLGIGLAVAGLLTACGPDGDSGGEEGIISKGGECVKIAHASRERTVKFMTRLSGEGFSRDEYSDDVTRDNGKVVTVRIKDEDSQEVVESKFEYYIKNNYLHITKSEVSYNGELQMTTLSDPYSFRLPSDKVCKGQSWIDEFTDTYIIVDQEETQSTTKIIFSIEDVNVKKTVEAGEFSTYVMIQYFANVKGKVSHRDWFDMKTGHPIYRESYNKDGTIKMTHELIEVIEGNF